MTMGYDVEAQDRARISQALSVLKRALHPYVALTMEQTYGTAWEKKARSALPGVYNRPQEEWDAQALLIIMQKQWYKVYQDRLGYVGRNLVDELRTLRNLWAHDQLAPPDTHRFLDSCSRLLAHMGEAELADLIRADADAVMRRQLLDSSAATYDRQSAAPMPGAALHILKGKAHAETFRIENGAVNMGRLQEVRDAHGRILRQNDLYFLDHRTLTGPDERINETVSRRHARIIYSPERQGFLLLNEQGSTSVMRPGFPAPVRVRLEPVPLQDQDVIYLGEAAIRFTLAPV